MTKPYDQFGHRVSISPEHYRIHEGESFTCGHFWSQSDSTTMIADNGSAVLIVNPVSRANHAIIGISAGGQCEIYHYSGVTASTTGVSVTPVNKNDYSGKTSSTLVSHSTSTGIISDTGTAWPGVLLPGGSGGNKVGGLTGTYDTEHIVKHGTKHAVIVRNRSGGVIPISVTLEWYEPGASS